MKKKIFKIILLMIIFPTLFSSFVFLREYSDYPLICQLKSQEFIMKQSDGIDQRLSTYFSNVEENLIWDTKDLVFDQGQDFETKIKCGLFQYEVTFHRIDDVAPKIEMLNHFVDIALNQDFGHIYQVQENSDYEVETNLEFQDLQVGIHNFCVSARDIYGNESKECTYIHVNDSRFLQMDKVDDLKNEIDAYLSMMNITNEEIAISYENLVTKETFTLNENQPMFAASLYKLPLAMVYYKAIQEGRFTLHQLLEFQEEDYEYGGPVATSYEIGSWISIDELLYDSIVYSDNSAARILFNGLGGWERFKTEIKKYSDMKYDRTFYNNEFTVEYLQDVLNYLYQHKEEYPLLIEYMGYVYPDDYLNRYVNSKVIQKYGEYDTVQNIAGIVLTQQPYAVAIMVDSYADGIEIIGRINEIMYYYNTK